MVHRREVGGEEVVLGNQGALWHSAMTWWDHDTGSVWSQPLGEAILGERKGQTLELLPSTLTRWASWKEAHPETLALDASGRTAGFALRRMAIVLDFGAEAAAYPVPLLREVGVANDEVAGVEVAVLFDPADDERWAVFSRRLDDHVVTLQVVAGRLLDVETGTQWDPVSGRAVDGLLAPQVLDRLPAFTAFPGDFAEIWPAGRLWEPERTGISLRGFVTNYRD